MKIDESMYKYDGLKTDSCMYLFKPTKDAVKATLKDQTLLKYEGNLVKGYQIYGHDQDFHFEKTIILKHDDEAAHIVTQSYIIDRHDIELAYRHSSGDFEHFYSGDSLSFIHRKYIDVNTAKERNLTRPSSRSNTDILGLNAYPMVDGFIVTSKDKTNVGFTNSQTCASHLIDDKTFEFIVARSINNINQDKGLPERLSEKFQTHFNYKMFIRKDMKAFYDLKNKYVDQMNDPLLLIENKDSSLVLPEVEYKGHETSDIDVMSLKLNQDDRGIDKAPIITRLRNRSSKPVLLDRHFLQYQSAGSQSAFLGYLSDVKFGFSQQVTLKQLGYKQKVSEDYNVNNTHSVLKGYRDDFVTFEKLLKQRMQNQKVHYEKSDKILLQPGEISNLRMFIFKVDKHPTEQSYTLKREDINFMTEEINKLDELLNNVTDGSN